MRVAAAVRAGETSLLVSAEGTGLGRRIERAQTDHRAFCAVGAGHQHFVMEDGQRGGVRTMALGHCEEKNPGQRRGGARLEQSRTTGNRIAKASGRPVKWNAPAVRPGGSDPFLYVDVANLSD